MVRFSGSGRVGRGAHALVRRDRDTAHPKLEFAVKALGGGGGVFAGSLRARRTIHGGDGIGEGIRVDNRRGECAIQGCRASSTGDCAGHLKRLRVAKSVTYFRHGGEVSTRDDDSSRGQACPGEGRRGVRATVKEDGFSSRESRGASRAVECGKAGQDMIDGGNSEGATAEINRRPGNRQQAAVECDIRQRGESIAGNCAA